MESNRKITLDQLVPMDLFVDEFPLRIEVAYAHDNNLLFGERIYKADARLVLHKDLALIVLKAAQTLREKHNLRLVLFDGLRTIDAQEKMLETQRVKDNPGWLEEPRLLSPPGAGGHPRGMAVDVTLETMDGALLDMGTAFDYLASDPRPEHNPAHRNHPHLSEEVMKNRNILHNAILKAGEKLVAAGEVKVMAAGLPEEWWDFRFPAEYYNQYAPLRDSDLPRTLQCLEGSEIQIEDLSDQDWEHVKSEISSALKQTD